MCSPSSGAWRVWNRSGPRESRIGRVLHRDVPITGWSTSSKKPRCAQLLEVRLTVRLHDLADGHASVPQELHDVVGRPVTAPRLQVLVDPVVRPGPAVGGRRGRVAPPTPGRPSASRSAVHCSSVATAIATQQSSRPYSSTPAGLVQVLRRRDRAPVAGPLQQRAVRASARSPARRRCSARRRPWPPRPGRPRRCGRGAPARAAARPARAARRWDRRRSTARAAAGRARPVSHVRPGRVLDHEGERGLVAPRPVEPEAGHPHHDEVGLDLAQRLVVEPGVVEHPGRVVLDDDVARRDEPAHEVDAPRVAEVDRQALLVRVERGEDRAALPVLLLGLRARRRRAARRRAGPPTPGGSPRHRAAPACGRRAGRPSTRSCRAPAARSNGSDPGAPSRRRGARSAVQSSRCSPSRGAGSGRGGGSTTSGTAGRGWSRRRAGWRRTCRARGSARSSWRWRRATIGAFGMRKADACSSTSSTVRSPIQASIVGSRAVRSRKSFGSSVHSGWPTMHAEVEPLLAGAAPEPDQPVAGRADAGRRHEPLLAHRPAELVVEGHRVVGQARSPTPRASTRRRARRPRRRAGATPASRWRRRCPASHSPIWPPTWTGARSGQPRAEADDAARPAPAA